MWQNVYLTIIYIYIYAFMHLADAFIQSDLQCIQAIHLFVSMCVPWELNPQPFALLTQCSTTEPQENLNLKKQLLKFAYFSIDLFRF